LKTWPAVVVRLVSGPSGDREEIAERLPIILDDFIPSAIHELDDQWVVFFHTARDRDMAAEALRTALPGHPPAEIVDVADEDWARRSQQSLTAVEVGRVVIAPPWAATHQASAAGTAGPLTIVILPSMGFGTGHHATTRLCAALLQRLDIAGMTVLDVGTGSGVLALVARALGASAVVAVDDDPDAIESARDNLVLNGGGDGIELRVGDFRGMSDLRADVVIANLTGGLLTRGADLLAKAVAPGGRLVISGVMLDEEAAVLAAFAPALAVTARTSEDEWVAAILQPGSVPQTPATPASAVR
jgi:ribosomal protein L11 methyltransferase